MTIEVFLRVKSATNAVRKLPGVTMTADSPLRYAVSDAELYKVVASLFDSQHYAKAVEEGFKFLNNLVKARVSSSDDGASLMRHVFSANNPVLKLNKLASRSEKDEQQGYMDVLAGCMTGIRNPRAHEHEWTDTRATALQLLTWANHLVERVRLAERA